MRFAGLLASLAVATSYCPPPSSIVIGARVQLDWNTRYDPAYYKLDYPNGDLPKTKGVCTDVVIRALRYAGADLQKLIHEDMSKRWSSYPRYSGLSKPDRNIDHRRVPNQRAFFKKHATRLRTSSDWKPGDLVYWKLDNGLDHCGVVTDRRGPSGDWMVIHNLATTSEDDCLNSWTITDHFRIDLKLLKPAGSR